MKRAKRGNGYLRATYRRRSSMLASMQRITDNLVYAHSALILAIYRTKRREK